MQLLDSELTFDQLRAQFADTYGDTVNRMVSTFQASALQKAVGGIMTRIKADKIKQRKRYATKKDYLKEAEELKDAIQLAQELALKKGQNLSEEEKQFMARALVDQAEASGLTVSDLRESSEGISTDQRSEVANSILNQFSSALHAGGDLRTNLSEIIGYENNTFGSVSGTYEQNAATSATMAKRESNLLNEIDGVQSGSEIAGASKENVGDGAFGSKGPNGEYLPLPMGPARTMNDEESDSSFGLSNFSFFGAGDEATEAPAREVAQAGGAQVNSYDSLHLGNGIDGYSDAYYARSASSASKNSNDADENLSSGAESLGSDTNGVSSLTGSNVATQNASLNSQDHSVSDSNSQNADSAAKHSGQSLANTSSATATASASASASADGGVSAIVEAPAKSIADTLLNADQAPSSMATNINNGVTGTDLLGGSSSAPLITGTFTDLDSSRFGLSPANSSSTETGGPLTVYEVGSSGAVVPKIQTETFSMLPDANLGQNSSHVSSSINAQVSKTQNPTTQSPTISREELWGSLAAQCFKVSSEHFSSFECSVYRGLCENPEFSFGHANGKQIEGPSNIEFGVRVEELVNLQRQYDANRVASEEDREQLFHYVFNTKGSAVETLKSLCKGDRKDAFFQKDLFCEGENVRKDLEKTPLYAVGWVSANRGALYFPKGIKVVPPGRKSEVDMSAHDIEATGARIKYLLTATADPAFIDGSECPKIKEAKDKAQSEADKKLPLPQNETTTHSNE